MKAILLAAALTVLPSPTIKHVKENKVFFSVDDAGNGVWWDLFVADDDSTCRHLWAQGQDYKDRWVECRWVEHGKVKVEEEPKK